MIELLWSEDAEVDVDQITAYIAERNVIAAIDTRDEIELRVKNLKTFPNG